MCRAIEIDTVEMHANRVTQVENMDLRDDSCIWSQEGCKGAEEESGRGMGRKNMNRKWQHPQVRETCGRESSSPYLHFLKHPMSHLKLFR